MNFVTDPVIWERFNKNMASNQFNPYTYRRSKKRNQLGRELHGRFRNSYMIPVNPNAVDTDTNPVKPTVILHVAAAEERASSEMKVVREKKKPHVRVLNNIKTSRKN